MHLGKSGIPHQSSMQKVTPGQVVSFVPQHTTSQRSYEPVMPFASPPSSSWQLLCLLMPLLFIALKLHSVQQQRIQTLPVFWLACGLSQIAVATRINAQPKLLLTAGRPHTSVFPQLASFGLAKRLAEKH
jgi:hypothetical protein